MIWLGFRLVLNSGREARGRLVATALGIAVSCALLFGLLAAFQGFDKRDQRRAWLETAFTGTATADGAPTTGPLLWQYRTDDVGGRTIQRVTVAARGPNAPVPPGLPRLPANGQYYASPALAGLIATTSKSQLGDRFPGTMAGTIGDKGLPTADALIAVVGADPAVLVTARDAWAVDRIQTAPASYPDFFRILLGVGAIGLFFPVVVFIGTATRLAAARREQRFAALRLVGATPRQVSVLAAIESALSALAGSALGLAMFAALRPLATRIRVGGGTFFMHDLTLTPLLTVALVLAVVGAAVASALAALRGVRVTPLGVSRQARRGAPRAWRTLPLLAGLAVIVLPPILRTSDLPTGALTMVVLGGFFLSAAGIVLIGPWLTFIASRVLARRTGSAAGLIAARRLADNRRRRSTRSAGWCWRSSWSASTRAEPRASPNGGGSMPRANFHPMKWRSVCLGIAPNPDPIPTGCLPT